MQLLLTLTFFASSITFANAMIKLVGPEETAEDLSRPISQEYEITWYRFKSYYDDGNTQWKVLDIARKYYTNKDSTLTYQNFVQAGKEYLINNMVESQMTFQGMGKILPKLQNALTHYLHERKNKTFNLEEFFKHTCQGQFKQFLKVNIAFEDQPWEVQQKLIHELEEKKRKSPDHHHRHDLHSEEHYIYGHKNHKKEIPEMRKHELRRRFQLEYTGIEWLDDGRRVTDEDYDQEAPAKERRLHNYGFKRDNITDDLVDELLEFELDL